MQNEIVANEVLMHGYKLVSDEFSPEKYQVEPPLTPEEREQIIDLADGAVYNRLVFTGSLKGFDAASVVKSAHDFIVRHRQPQPEIKTYEPSEWKIE